MLHIAPFVLNMVNFSNYTSKSYKHIDKKISFDKVKNYAITPSSVARHSFLPFIHYQAISDKYNQQSSNIKNRPIKRKERSIYYSGHLDSYIYRYYSDTLNKFYNQYAKDIGIDGNSVAYRTNAPHRSSINFSAEVFAFLSSISSGIILVGDFTSFFDNLDHHLLKIRLQKVLEVPRLSPDWYNVFKSLTKFGYIERDELEKIPEEIVQNGKGHHSYFKTISDFRAFQKYYKTKYNKEKFGIPQGSALSGVLANVYSIDFDRDMSNLAKMYNGLYKRYSDDFILILSTSEDGLVEKLKKDIANLAHQNKIKLQQDKTRFFFKKEQVILKEDGDTRAHIDFLGFTFDGFNVRMRERSIYKFYRNARKLILLSKKLQKKMKLKKLPNRHKIYSLYTDFGKSMKYPSNFISYAKRSQKIFDEISPATNNLMMEQLKNRKKIVEKALGYKIHSQI